MTGCSPATRTARRWRGTNASMPRPARCCRRSSRRWWASSRSPMGARAVPVFQLLAERYLDPSYSADVVAAQCGCPPIRSAASRPSSPKRRSRSRSCSISPGPIGPGRKHDKMIGRPVVDARDARHLGAFQRLPHLPRAARAADAAGRHRYARLVPLQIPLPAPDPAGAQAGRPCASGEAQSRRSRACRWAIRMGPRICCSIPTARRGASTRRIRGRRRSPRTASCIWSSPMRGRVTLQDRHAVHVHGEHVVELGDEHRRHDRHADRQGRERRLQDSAHHLFGRVFLRDGRVCRPDPARYDVSRALGLHLAARPADRQRGRPRRCDPPAGHQARPRCAAVPGCADRSRRTGSKLPGFTNLDGSRKYPGGYPDYLANHERKPGVGPLAGWRGADGDA